MSLSDHLPKLIHFAPQARDVTALPTTQPVHIAVWTKWSEFCFDR